ncbi:hypothetical protein F5Y15DRAFT_411373 [Xylariaceae sp. FL0016]|nr:hypothetical protein F5Y15DRAFT_411373 [Xylariaceae sp. FL0016]
MDRDEMAQHRIRLPDGRMPLPSKPMGRQGITQIAQPAKESTKTISKPRQAQAKDKGKAKKKKKKRVSRECPECHRTFAQRAQHYAVVHLGTVCFWPGCCFTATSKMQLHDHLKEHNDELTGDNPQGPLICHWPGCGQTWNAPVDIDRCLHRHNRRAKLAAAEQDHQEDAEETMEHSEDE